MITHIVDSVFWPQSFTSSYVLKWRSFCNSASFAEVASLRTLLCFCTKLMFASSVISSHCTWSRFTLFFSLLTSSCMLYRHLFLPVAFLALPSTVAVIHSSVFCNLYWVLSFAFGVFLFFWIFCVPSLSGFAAGNSSDTVWGSVSSFSSCFSSSLSSRQCSLFLTPSSAK